MIQKTPGMILLFIILFSDFIMFLFTPLINLISRQNEFNADKMGAEIGNKEHLKSALIKLVKENKSFPRVSKFYSFIHYSHPPILDRLEELEDKK